MWESLTTMFFIKAKQVVTEVLGQPGVDPASILPGWKKLVSARTPGQLEPLTQLEGFRLSAHAVGSGNRVCNGCWLWSKKRLTQAVGPEKGSGSISHNSSNISACSLALLKCRGWYCGKWDSLRNISTKTFTTGHTYIFKQCLNAAPRRTPFMSLFTSLEQVWDQI